MRDRTEIGFCTGTQTGKKQKTSPLRPMQVYMGSLTETSKEGGMQNLQIVIREAGERGEELFVLEAAKYVRP